MALFGSAVGSDSLAAWSVALALPAGSVYLGPSAEAEAAAALGLRVLPPARNMAEAVRNLAAAGIAGDLLLVALAAELPALANDRLAAFAQQSDADVITPLSADLAELSPIQPGCGPFDNRQLDALCNWLGERWLLPVRRPSALCALWRERARLMFADSEVAPGHWPRAISVSALPNLYVGQRAITTAAPALDQGPTADPVPGSPLASLRLRLRAVEGRYPETYPGYDRRPVLLHVLHGWGGGIERFVRDLAADDDQHIHLALRSLGSSARRRYGEALGLAVVDARGFHPLREWPLPLPIEDSVVEDLGYRAVLDQVLADYGVGAVLLSSLIGHSLDALRTGLPTIYVCHDYYPLWPVLHADFGDASLAFDESELAGAIISASSAAFPFTERAPGHWLSLRSALVEALRQGPITLVAPSRSVRANWLRIEPTLAQCPAAVIEHGFAPFPSVPAKPSRQRPRGRLRLLVLGRIHGGKAEQLLLPALDRLGADAELWLLGCGASGHALFGRSGVHIVLDYARAELPELIRTIDPDAALLPASVAESFSYTLSELWALGVVPIASRLGSFAERIEHQRTGWLFAPNPEDLIACVRHLAANPAEIEAIRARLPDIALRTPAEARAEYLALLGALDTKAPRWRPIDAGMLELAERADQQQQLQAEARHLREAIAAAECELQARTEWALANEREVRRVGASIRELKQAHERLGEEFNQRSAWALQLDQEVQQLRADLQHSFDNYQHLEQEKSRADAGWAQAERMRQELLASHSWRLTRPLRALAIRGRLLRARLRYLLSLATTLPTRITGSLRKQGLRATWRRIIDRAKHPPLVLAPAAITVPVGADEDGFEPFALLTSETPQVSVVIPVFNKFAYTRACLQSIASHGAERAFEVIVVDDASSDQTAAGLAQIGGLRVIRNAENLGFIGACNRGAAAALGDYLLFLNNDTQVTAGWLDALIETFAQHPKVGLVGAKLVYPDGRLQEAGGIVFADASGWNLGRFGDPADPAYNYLREVDYCSGAAIAVPRDWFAAVGGFDLRYAPAYYEDTDLAFRVREEGLRVLYQPRSTVIHFEGITSGTDTGSGVKRYQVRNQEIFAARWRERLDEQPAPGTPIAIAREHRVRGRILIVDATFPEPDKDSGSLRMVNVVRALIALGYKVCFTSENRAYSAGYCESLQALGVEVLYHPWLRDPVAFLRETGASYDAVMLSRHYVASPLLPLVRAYAPRALLIFDTVDLHYLREQREAELAGDDDLRRRAGATQLSELRLVRSADVTLVVSPIEQALLQREVPGARVEVLSNVHEPVGCRRGFAERADLFFVGGFQHQPNVDAMLWFVAEVWPLIAERLRGVCFHIVGSRMPESVRALASDRVVVAGFAETLDRYLDGCRLSVAPLRYGAGVKGKVNQSMAHGQPVVATSLAAEGMFLQHEREVLIADQATDFAEQVVRLYQDPALWQTLSAAGLENIERHFSFAAASKALRGILGG